MIQANTVLENTITPEMETIELLRTAESVLPESELELFIDEEDDREEFLDSQSEEDTKSGKGAKARRRAQAKKKHYTEDSIRLYLQEIGRIRLLRADE